MLTTNLIELLTWIIYLLKKKIENISLILHLMKNSMKSISDRVYTQGRGLGSGTFGTVYSVTRDDGVEFAFKKFNMETKDLDLGILRELSILKIFQGNQNGIMNLEDIIFSYENEKIFGIVMKKYPLDLHDAMKLKLLSKNDRRHISKKLLEAVYFLHSNGVIHRDIKPENVLLDENNNPVLADYTLSKVFDGVCLHGSHTNKIATATYRAPEVVSKKPYGFPSDIWSLGVVFYELFSGKQLTINTDMEALDFLSKQIPKFREDSLGNMVRGLLIFDPEKRWTAKKALESEMFKTSPKLIKIRKGISKVFISSEVNEFCDNLDVEKKVTRFAAQKYVNKTGCSAWSAVELACKFYETELREYENEEFPEEELEILIKMNYNLFI
jgi:serine/threonine protein kinase